MRRRTRRRLLGLLTVTALVVGYRAVVAPALRRAGVATLGAPTVPAAPRDRLRVVSWNLRNFPEDDGHAAAVSQALAELDAAVYALQEIRDVDALRATLPGYRVVASRGGGRGRQHVAIAYDPARVRALGEPDELTALTMGGRVRPGLHLYVRAREAGPDFHLVVVHLKARPDGLDLRRRQWPRLADWVAGLRESGDGDLLLVGDFNATGPKGGSPEEEREQLARALDPAGLALRAPAGGCSAYWEGARRDAWKEPSLLDLVWTAELTESLVADERPVAAGPCARLACDRLRSTRAYPDREYEEVSDHCPLVLDLRLGDDDPS